MSSYVFAASNSDNQIYHTVRAKVARNMEQLYDGWSDAFDSQFDRTALCFTLQNAANDEILASARIIFSDSPVRTVRFPMELADVGPFSLPSEDVTISEASGLIFADYHTARLLLYRIGEWLDQHGKGDCYLTFDTRNLLIKRLYTKTCRFEMVDGGLVSFESFRYKGKTTPVSWQVVVDRASTRRVRMQRHYESLAPSLKDILQIAG